METRNPFFLLYKYLLYQPNPGTVINDIMDKVKQMIKTTNKDEYLQLHHSINHVDNSIQHIEYAKLISLILNNQLYIPTKKLLFSIEPYLTISISSIFNSIFIDGNQQKIKDYISSNIRWNPQLTEDNNNRTEYLKTNLNIDIEALKPNNYPKNGLLSFEGMDYLVNESLYAFDMMKRDNKTELFIIDSRFMSKYEQKPNYLKGGCCISYFKLTKHGFKLQKIKYNDETLYRKNRYNSSSFLPFYALYFDILTYVTICVHAIQCHYITSANLTDKNTRYLSLDHPIRQLLLPTELNCINNDVGNIITALIKNGDFYNIFAYTDKGLIDMINDNILHHRYDFFTNDTLFSKLHLSKEEMEYYPIKTYATYYKLLDELSNNFVNECVSQGLMDDEIKTWVDMCYPVEDRPSKLSTKAIVKRIIQGIFFHSVKHKMSQNANFTYFWVQFPVIQLNENTNDYYIDLTTLNYTCQLAMITNVEIIDITKNMSFLIDNPTLKSIVNDFHHKINKLDKNYPSNFISCLKPSDISFSIGM